MNNERLQACDALLHEDLITPLHDHDESRNRLVADVDGEARVVTPAEAGAHVRRVAGKPELHEVEHTADGPWRVKRRHVLAGAAAGFGALLAASSLPRYSFAAPSATPSGAPAASGGAPLASKPVVVIFMRGGFDGLSAVVPVNDRDYYRIRPGIAVRPEQTIPLAGGMALNSNLGALKPLWDEGSLAIIQGAGTPQVTRSHFTDQVTVESAAPANVRSGWLARHLQTSSAETGTFRGISIGTSTALSLTTTAFDTVAMSTIGSFDLQTWGDAAHKERVQGTLDRMYGRAGGDAASRAGLTLQAVGALATERDRATAAKADTKGYPDTPFGRGMREIAQMLRSGLGVEAACIDYGNWDMHRELGVATNEKDWFSRQARDFADSIAAFRRDLGDVWSRTTLVTMSEFGRRAEQNGSNGVDHGRGNVMFVGGGGIKGGRLYGKNPVLSPSGLLDGDVPITLDYRQPLSELITGRLGNNKVDQVFPGFTPGTALGLV